ncbi:MAG: FHA domain-containing protein [Candidatus Rifleibacteriota bacterium]
MKKNAIVLFIVLVFLWSAVKSFAASAEIPELVRPGDLFIVRITADPGVDHKISIETEQGKFQFMGAVQGTPDIQMHNDSLIEIEPKSSGGEICYELKFLPLGSTGGFVIIRDSGGEKKIEVKVVRDDSSKNYSWFILAGGIALLLIGLKVWRFQKSAPAMMSTKSLFMNFEELEKARKMYFDDSHNKENQKSDSVASLKEPSIPVLETVQPASENSETIKDPQRTSQRSVVKTELEERVGSLSGKTAANHLKIELTDEGGQRYEAAGEVIKVGRRRDNQLVLTGSEISREHVMFFRNADKVMLKSLTDSNVTQLNGQAVKGDVHIVSGAKLNLGGTVFTVQIKV